MQTSSSASKIEEEGGMNPEKRVAIEPAPSNTGARAVTSEATREPDMDDYAVSLVSEALQSSFPFCDDTDAEGIARRAKPMRVEEGVVVAQQGVVGSCEYYIVQHGTFDVYVDSIKVASIHKGCDFGQIALLYDTARTATIVCASAGFLWVISRDVFRETLVRKLVTPRDLRTPPLIHAPFVQAETASVRISAAFDALSSLPAFSGLSIPQMNSLAMAAEEKVFAGASCIIRKGDVGDAFYIIKEGQVRVTDIGEGPSSRDTWLGACSYFGEQALLFVL